MCIRDSYKGVGKDFDYQWEERWVRDEGYGKIIPKAIAGYLKKTGANLADFAKVIYPCYFTGTHRGIAKQLGIDPSRLQDNMHNVCGDTGTAHPLLMLASALEQAKPGGRLGDISWAVQSRVEEAGLSVVRSLVGHGIGREMHEDPQVPNFGEPGRGPLLEEGMVLAIEPMVTAGRHMVRMGDDGWAIFSQDGSLSAHFEFTVAITADGPRILNPWHLPDGEEASGAALSAEARP